MNEEQKQCMKCSNRKPFDDFYMRNGKPESPCKSCTRARQREYESSPTIKAKNREYLRKYRQVPKNKKRAKLLGYRRSQKPEAKKRRREYLQRPDIKAGKREYHREYAKRPGVKERFRESARKHRQHPENRKRNRIHKHNRNARESSLPNTLTHDQWQHALNYFNGCCAICDRQMNDMFGEFTIGMDHWIPLSYKGDNPGTVAGNIVPLCHGVGGCNNQKHNALPQEWLARQFGKRKAVKILQRIQEYFDSVD